MKKGSRTIWRTEESFIIDSSFLGRKPYLLLFLSIVRNLCSQLFGSKLSRAAYFSCVPSMWFYIVEIILDSISGTFISPEEDFFPIIIAYNIFLYAVSWKYLEMI